MKRIPIYKCRYCGECFEHKNDLNETLPHNCYGFNTHEGIAEIVCYRLEQEKESDTQF